VSWYVPRAVFVALLTAAAKEAPLSKLCFGFVFYFRVSSIHFGEMRTPYRNARCVAALPLFQIVLQSRKK
jgi:hypothetical protein